jgi:hypothetical protein
MVADDRPLSLCDLGRVMGIFWLGQRELKFPAVGVNLIKT